MVSGTLTIDKGLVGSLPSDESRVIQWTDSNFYVTMYYRKRDWEVRRVRAEFSVSFKLFYVSGDLRILPLGKVLQLEQTECKGQHHDDHRGKSPA